MKPFTNKHSHEAREKAALMNDMPIDNRGVGQMNTSALLDAGHGGKGHPHSKQKDVKKDIVSIPASDPEGNFYNIDVRSGSAYEKMSKNLGVVPSALRPGSSFTKETDYRTTGISKDEKAKRLNAAKERERGL